MGFLKDIAFRFLSRRQRFTRIYRKGQWGERETASGPGSTLVATDAIRRVLPGLFERYGVRTLLDAPCGDFHWMSQLLAQNGDRIDYTGVDIVPDIIAENRRRWSSARVRFMEADLLEDSLPESDLILCNDCLIHLSLHDIFRALRNMRRSGSTYLLTNSYSEVAENTDIVTGRWRFINLELAPFLFPEPLERIEKVGPKGKQLALWRLADLDPGAA